MLPWYRTLTKYQWLVLTIAWLGWVFDIMDTALFILAKGPMLREMMPGGHTESAEALLQALLLVGWSIGGLVCGVLADRWGRVRTMVLTVLIYCVFTGLTAFCHSVEQVAVVRFITALGIGGEWAAGAALLAEAFPDKARAPGAGLLQTAAAFGPWFAALAQLLVLSAPVAGALPASFASWRILFLIGILPAAITIVLRLGLKEPERWTMAKEQTARSGLFQPLVELFSHPMWRRHAFVSLVLGIVGIAAAGNITYWLPNMVKANYPSASAAEVGQHVAVATLVMHLGTLGGVLVMPWLCEKIGRRKALATFFILSPLSVFFVSRVVTAAPSLLLVLTPVMSFFTIGMSAGFVLYFPELFPTAIRATGIGFAYNTSRVLAGAVPFFTAFLMGRHLGFFTASTGSAVESVANTSLLLAIGIVALFFAPETKGKGLPEKV